MKLLSCAYILSKLVDLGDFYPDVERHMIEQGFPSVTSNSLILDSLATDKEELALHRKVVAEKGKERFANPFNLMFELTNSDSYNSPYHSELLTRFRQERELAWGASEKGDDYAVWIEPDPCLRLFMELSFDERKKQLDSCREEFFRARAIEVANKLPAPHKRLRLNKHDAHTLAFKVLEDALNPLGFNINQKISSKSATLFSKPVVDDWILCMTFRRSDWGFDQYSYEKVNGVKRITPKTADFHLDLRKSGKKGLANKDLGFLPLAIAEMTPLGAFEFSRYLDADDMVVGILGYVEMYSFFDEKIESILQNVLTSPDLDA